MGSKRWSYNSTNERGEMSISVNMAGRTEVMLIKTLETGGSTVVVFLRNGVKVLTNWGLRLPSSPSIVA